MTESVDPQVVHPAGGRRCDECGFLFASVDAGNASAAVARISLAYTDLLRASATQSLLRQRPSATVWSPLEYAAHMRDVLLLFGRRIQVILREEQPQLEVVSTTTWSQAGNYNRLDPLTVATEIRRAGRTLAGILDGLAPGDFMRRGLRDGEERAVPEISQRAAHESQHHLLDMARGLGRPTAAALPGQSE